MCGGVRSFMEAKKTGETKILFERLFSGNEKVNSLTEVQKNFEYTFELHLRSNTARNKLQEKLPNTHECSLPFYLSSLPSFFFPSSIFSSMLYLILNSDRGSPR